MVTIWLVSWKMNRFCFQQKGSSNFGWTFPTSTERTRSQNKLRSNHGISKEGSLSKNKFQKSSYKIHLPWPIFSRQPIQYSSRHFKCVSSLSDRPTHQDAGNVFAQLCNIWTKSWSSTFLTRNRKQCAVTSKRQIWWSKGRFFIMPRNELKTCVRSLLNSRK